MAADPTPSANPLFGNAPASVVTTRDETTIRRKMRLELSATIATAPAESTAIPEGRVNDAAVPIPSARPETPDEPASVDTVRDDMTSILIMLLSRSAISATVLAAFQATPRGRLNAAAEPTPFVEPATPGVPARVDTAPEDSVTKRIM